jgi:hypothetical protein
VLEAAEEPALFQGQDQAVDARLGLEVQGLFHLVEGGGDAVPGDPVADEEKELVLLFGEHRVLLSGANTPVLIPKTDAQTYGRPVRTNQETFNVLLWFFWLVKGLVGFKPWR